MTQPALQNNDEYPSQERFDADSSAPAPALDPLALLRDHVNVERQLPSTNPAAASILENFGLLSVEGTLVSAPALGDQPAGDNQRHTPADANGVTASFTGGDGLNRVLRTHAVGSNGLLDRIETQDGRIFRRNESGHWTVSRQGSTETQTATDVTVSARGELTYHPGDDPGRTIRETRDGRYFVTGRDGVEREYVDSSQYERRPGRPTPSGGPFGNMSVPDGTPQSQLDQATDQRRAHGGTVDNTSNRPIIVLGNAAGTEHGAMQAYILPPHTANNPVEADVDAVVTDSRFQPIIAPGGRVLMPASIPPDATAVKISDTGLLTVSGGYASTEVSRSPRSWVISSTGTIGSLNLSGGQPVTPQPRLRRR